MSVTEGILAHNLDISNEDLADPERLREHAKRLEIPLHNAWGIGKTAYGDF